MEKALTKNIRQFANVVLDQNPVHAAFMERALANISDDEVIHLDSYIDFCLKKGRDIEYLAESYLTIVMDTIREQIYFQKHGTYRHSTFAEVANDVYFNPEYMAHYMYGLAFTSFLWPNHLAMFSFFKKTLPHNVPGKYLEIGPGHGYYLMTAMQQSGYGSFLGVDISDTSVAARNLAEKSFDAVVMGEVLEHVEQPKLFLRRIHEIAKDNAYIYLTTCINAPEIDHIYLFKTPEKIAQMFMECGLEIKDQLICPYVGKTLQESLDQKLAVNVAYVLKKG